MFFAKKKAAQSEFWIAADQVVAATKSGFYAKLDETLESFGFAAQVRALCAPAYDQSGVGRPGIDPVVYLKMLMVGFFENLPSERAMAARCADSIAIRQFLHYELTEATPDHSSLSVIRQRLGGPVFEQVFTLVLSALQAYGVGQLQALQQEQIKTVMGDPINHRRLDKLEPAEQRAVKAAGRSTRSQYGKALLRKRGQHLERAFAHILDCGGMRRATLRGLQNLQKRFKLAAAFYNLSQLMRQRFGVGTPKQGAAMGRNAAGAFLRRLVLGLWALAVELMKTKPSAERNDPTGLLCSLKSAT